MTKLYRVLFNTQRDRVMTCWMFFVRATSNEEAEQIASAKRRCKR